MDEQHFGLMAKRMLDNRVVPFLGAGVNMCGRRLDEPFAEGRHLPSGTELATYLASEFRMSGDETSLARVSQNTVVLVGDGPLYDTLRKVFDHDYEPTDVHRFLAGMPQYARRAAEPSYQLIISTNYDDALERAFAERDEPVDVLTYMEKGKHAGRFVHTDPDGVRTTITSPNRHELRLEERPTILKIHGAIDRATRQNDSFVITEDDYIEYVIRAGSELKKVFPPDVLNKANASHFLFLGYSLRDWNLRVILNRIIAERVLSYESWSVQLEANELDRRAWKARGVEVITVPLEDYVARLRDALAVETSPPAR